MMERKGVARAATDIESLAAGLERILGKEKRINEILDKQNIADLRSVAVNRNWLACGGANQEMSDPALVLGTELVRTVDAAHAKNRRRKGVGMGVIQDVLVSGAFRAAIRGAKIERA